MSNNVYEGVICVLTGKPAPNPMDSRETLQGYQSYLNKLGVKYFSAAEMCMPHRQDVADELGYHNLLPNRRWWSKGGALALMADRVRQVAGHPVKMRNWHRPSDYNLKVGGALGSDHVSATAVDLDFQKADHARRCEKWLLDLYHKNLFELSLGLGGQSIHLGIFSPKGQRKWYYKSHPSQAAIS